MSGRLFRELQYLLYCKLQKVDSLWVEKVLLSSLSPIRFFLYNSVPDAFFLSLFLTL